jgi:hypothetical protein
VEEMNELDRYAVSLENMEVLRAHVEAQAREIEDWKQGAKVEADAGDAARAELSALKASGPALVMPDRKKKPDGFVTMPSHYEGWNACLDEVARLNQPASAGEAVIDLDAAAWTQIKEAASQSAWMPEQYFMNDWVSDICAFLREPRTGTAPSHSEQVRHMVPEGYALVPVEPTTDMFNAGYAEDDDGMDCKAIWAAMLAAAPSAGSQEQGE